MSHDKSQINDPLSNEIQAHVKEQKRKPQISVKLWANLALFRQLERYAA